MKKSDLLLPLTTLASAIFMIGFLIVGFLVIQINLELPDAESIKSVELKVPLRVYSADNLLISEFGNERRKPIEFDDFPVTLVNAVLASEDDEFYNHGGIDFSGLIRAAISNFRSGQTQQGASTITMQVARNFFLSREKTYLRKVKEILLAIKLEHVLSKQEILSLYLNKIFLGHRAYGFGAAANVYYGKNLNDITLAETAMLAGLPKAPSRYNPLRNAARATTRRNYVLGRMYDLEKITEEAYSEAIAAPVTAQKHSRDNGLVAPHIAEMVRAKLTSEFGEDAYWQGLSVYTTVQSKAQVAADSALRAGLRAYDRRHGFRGAIAHIELDKLAENLTSDNTIDDIQDYDDILSIYPRSHEQIPALITIVEEEFATAQTSDHGAVTIKLETARWARKHLTADLRGDPLVGLGDILTAGDIVYLEPVPVDDKVGENKNQALDSEAISEPIEEQTKPVEWRLSQIPNVGGALISMDPNSGRILSLVGGYDFFLNKYNRAVQSIRQPGSNIKPFIYSASLDQGFTPASLISGAPIVMTDPVHGTVWRPENYSGKFFGPTRMREALGRSMNLVSIRLLRSIGIPYAREYTERFGIDMNRFASTLTMALGSGGVTPMQMVGAYSTLANGGYKIEPYFIEYITDRQGRIIYRAPQPEFCDECYDRYLPEQELPEEPLPEQEGELTEAQLNEDTSTPYNDEEDLGEVEAEDLLTTSPELDAKDEEVDEEVINEAADVPQTFYEAPRVMNSANNFLTVSMLKDVVKRGTARRALSLNRQDLAGKTGTTNDYVDAWFTGFNSKITTTVWVGFDNPATMGRGESGSLAALPIWVDYMKTGLEGVPEDSNEIPDFIEEALINKDTGQRTDEFDPDAIPEYFVIKELVPEFIATNLEDIDLETTLLIDNEAMDDQLLLDNEAYEETSLTDELLQNDLGIEDELNMDPSAPKERIIENEEDTEGLF